MHQVQVNTLDQREPFPEPVWARHEDWQFQKWAVLGPCGLCVQPSVGQLLYSYTLIPNKITKCQVSHCTLALTLQSLSPSCTKKPHKNQTSTKRKESLVLKSSKNPNYNECSLIGMFMFTYTLFCKDKTPKNGKAVY